MKALANARGSGGVVSVVALMFLAIFATLAVAFFSATSMNLAAASNTRSGVEARLAAESGQGFMTYKMERCGVLGSLRGQQLLNNLAIKLKEKLNGTGNLGGAVVTSDATGIHIPSIALAGGKSFTAEITLPDRDTLRLTVKGQFAPAGAPAVEKQVSIDFHPQWDQALGYGLCSKGPVQMGMNTDFTGIMYASDGSIFSSAPGLAVTIGSGQVSGDISTSDPNATTSLGSTVVGGSVITNAPPVTMPSIDRSGYKALAVNVMNSALPASGLYKNIIIPANTNPVFYNSVTIQGVMYVEAPNKISFMNNCNFTGVLVAADPPAGSPDADNYIYFHNNMTFYNSSQLPDTAEFIPVKKFTTAEVLAPGFTMEFKNNMTAVGGIMALKSLIAKNNLYSTVYGSLLIYGPSGLDFQNNSDMTIALSGSTPPPGFMGYGMLPLLPDATTYVEK